MQGLTYGVIRVDSEEKLSVLTVQDVGLVMPGCECGLGCMLGLQGDSVAPSLAILRCLPRGLMYLRMSSDQRFKVCSP